MKHAEAEAERLEVEKAEIYEHRQRLQEWLEPIQKMKAAEELLPVERKALKHAQQHIYYMRVKRSGKLCRLKSTEDRSSKVIQGCCTVLEIFKSNRECTHCLPQVIQLD